MEHGIIDGAGIEEEFTTDPLFMEDVTSGHGVGLVVVDILDALSIRRFWHV